MRFAFWGGLLGAVAAAGVQAQTYEMFHLRWIVTTAVGAAVLSVLLGRPLFDRIKTLIQRPPARYH